MFIGFSKILNSSGCEAQSEVMTCVCMSEGFPLPTIKWPLLENYNVHSAVTTVSNTTVSSTVILTVKDHRNTAVECISSNESGEAKENLTTRMSEGKTEEDGTCSQLPHFCYFRPLLHDILAPLLDNYWESFCMYIIAFIFLFLSLLQINPRNYLELFHGWKPSLPFLLVFFLQQSFSLWQKNATGTLLIHFQSLLVFIGKFKFVVVVKILFFFSPRIKHNSPVNLDGTLEMVTNQEDPLVFVFIHLIPCLCVYARLSFLNNQNVLHTFVPFLQMMCALQYC